jgi:hypothetical protein
MYVHIAFQVSWACDVCRISGECVTPDIQIHEDNIETYLKNGMLGYGPGLFRSGYDSEELVRMCYWILDFLKNAGFNVWSE